MAKIRVLECPECGASIRISKRDSGEIVVLDSEEANPLEDLKRV